MKTPCIILTPICTMICGVASVSVIATVDGREVPTRYSMSAGKYAERLMNAIKGGHGFINPELEHDIHNNEYVTFSVEVRGRYLNSDLKSLGY